MGFFWMLALPLKHRETSNNDIGIIEEDRNHLLSYLKEKLCASSDLAEVGTLDSLVTAGEELGRLDPLLESAVTRLVGNLKTLLGGDMEQVKSNLFLNEAFQWNHLKYRTDRNASEIAETLWAETQQIDNLLKARLATYNNSKASVAAIERMRTGSLVSKDLSPYIKGEDVVQDSEVLTTLMVVVPMVNKQDWQQSYEQLAPMVVPRSSRLIAEEDGYCLFNVTIFIKHRSEFVKNASEHKFIVREFKYDPALYQETMASNDAMQVDLENQWSSLVRLLKTNFGEVFSAWIHLKVLRLFVESVLCYGLPPQFLAVVLRPSHQNGGFGSTGSKGEKKLRIALLQSLEQLALPGISRFDVTTALHQIKDSSSQANETAEEAELWMALNMASQDQDPFVKVVINWNL